MFHSSPSVKSVSNETEEKGKGLCSVKNKERNEIISDLWKSGFILGFICGTLTSGSILTFMRVFTNE